MDDDTERYGTDAQARDTLRLAERGRDLDRYPIGRRMDLVRAIAKDRRASVHNDLRLIEHMLENGRQRHAIQRLERVEARLRLRAS